MDSPRRAQLRGTLLLFHSPDSAPETLPETWALRLASNQLAMPSLHRFCATDCKPNTRPTPPGAVVIVGVASGHRVAASWGLHVVRLPAQAGVVRQAPLGPVGGRKRRSMPAACEGEMP
jgi:hypothetical protein